jgi:tRNA(Ile)-lysidine synthase
MQANSLLPGYDPEIPLIRPFLETSKQEILDYCQSNNLNFVHDSSNDDDTYFRNWLVNDLLPQIEDKNTRFQESLNRTAKIISDEFDWMQETLDEEWKTALRGESEGYLQFDYLKVSKYIPGLFRFFARRAIQRLRPELRDIDFEDVERFYQFVLRPPKSARMDMVSGLDLVIEEGILTICNRDSEIPITDLPQIDHDFELEVPGEVQIGYSHVLKIEIVDFSELDSRYRENPNRMQAWLDLDLIEGRLLIRAVKPGDRIALLGYGGHSSKVVDVFNNHKVRRSARAHYPLFCTENQILWIPGILIADSVKISEKTKKVLQLWIE